MTTDAAALDEPEEVEDDGRAPKLNRRAFHCPRCGAFADQNWGDLRGGSDAFYDSQPDNAARAPGFPFTPTPRGRWRRAQCASCYDWSVWRDDRLIYPSSSPVALPHPQMPDDAKELYEEAREVVGISRRAGAALARASLERTLKALDPWPGRHDLDKRIEHVLGSVSDSLAQMLTVIRYAGNKSLHGDDGEPSEVMVLLLNPEELEIVDVIFDSINELVQELVTKPQKTRSLFDKLPDEIRAAFTKSQERAAAAPSTGDTPTP